MRYFYACFGAANFFAAGLITAALLVNPQLGPGIGAVLTLNLLIGLLLLVLAIKWDD